MRNHANGHIHRLIQVERGRQQSIAEKATWQKQAIAEDDLAEVLRRLER